MLCGAFLATHCAYSLRDGQAELTRVRLYHTQTKTVRPTEQDKQILNQNINEYIRECSLYCREISNILNVLAYSWYIIVSNPK